MTSISIIERDDIITELNSLALNGKTINDPEVQNSVLWTEINNNNVTYINAAWLGYAGIETPITSAGFSLMAHIISKCPSLRKVNISDTNYYNKNGEGLWKEDVMVEAAKTILKSLHINSFDISRNDLGDRVLEIIQEASSHVTYQSFDISLNNFRDRASISNKLVEIAKAIKCKCMIACKMKQFDYENYKQEYEQAMQLLVNNDNIEEIAQLDSTMQELVIPTVIVEVMGNYLDTTIDIS